MSGNHDLILGQAGHDQHGFRYPDGVNDGLEAISEVKNSAYVSLTTRLKDYADYARSHRYQFNLFVRSDTRLSSSVLNQINKGHINLFRIGMQH